MVGGLTIRYHNPVEQSWRYIGRHFWRAIATFISFDVDDSDSSELTTRSTSSTIANKRGRMIAFSPGAIGLNNERSGINIQL